MKSYFIDELNPKEIESIKRYLHKEGFISPIKDIFWIEIPEKLLTPIQREHKESCGPYIVSLETGKDWIKLELLIRATSKIRCSCISFANKNQRNFVIDLLDEIYSLATKDLTN